MQQPQANLKQAAVDFLEAAQAAAQAGKAAADPLDGVSTTLFDMGGLEPAITPQDLADLKTRLRQAELAPQTIVQLVALARQVAAALGGA
jgi:hypothetical protein